MVSGFCLNGNVDGDVVEEGVCCSAPEKAFYQTLSFTHAYDRAAEAVIEEHVQEI